MSETSEALALLPALWRASWQGGLVITALWCLCRILRKCRWFAADLRCWLWRAAYVRLLVSLAISGSVLLPVLPVVKAPNTPTVSALRTPDVGAAIPVTAPAALSGTAQIVAPPTLPWQAAIAVLYLIGVSVCLVRVVCAGLNTHQLLREAFPLRDADAEAEVADLASQYGLRQAPRLRMSASIAIPVYAAGTVLLPSDTNYSSEERRLILAHELAHARRRDLVWEWLGTLAQALFFFHPLVLLARREEHLARESAADAVALRITQSSPASYGKMLLSLSLVVSQSTPTFAGVVGAMESGKRLRRRLIALQEVNALSLSRKNLILFMGSSLAVAGAIVVPWRITQAAQPPTSEASADNETQKASSAGRLTLEIVTVGKVITLHYPLEEKSQANYIRIVADRVTDTQEGYRCSGKVVVTSSQDQKTISIGKTNYLLVEKQKVGQNAILKTDNERFPAGPQRRLTMAADQVTSTTTTPGYHFEGHVTSTIYWDGTTFSRIKADRAFLKKNEAGPLPKRPATTEIELSGKSVLEIRSNHAHAIPKKEHPEQGTDR